MESMPTCCRVLTGHDGCMVSPTRVRARVVRLHGVSERARARARARVYGCMVTADLSC
jgi:hypothetical protein